MTFLLMIGLIVFLGGIVFSLWCYYDALKSVKEIRKMVKETEKIYKEADEMYKEAEKIYDEAVRVAKELGIEKEEREEIERLN